MLAQHMAPGYHPSDLSVKVKDGRILMSGNHICTCSEDCITKEFSRSYSLPPRIDPSSIHASIDKWGKITVSGFRGRSGESQKSESFDVEVIGKGDFQKPTANELKACLSKKGSMTLNKMNKKTGKLVEPKDEELNLETAEQHLDLTEFDDENDTELTTIEVEY